MKVLVKDRKDGSLMVYTVKSAFVTDFIDICDSEESFKTDKALYLECDGGNEVYVLFRKTENTNRLISELFQLDRLDLARYASRTFVNPEESEKKEILETIMLLSGIVD